MANDSGSSKILSRTVAPFAPLALALAMGVISPTTRTPTPLAEEVPAAAETRDNAVAVKCDDVLDFQDCHSRFPTGCSQAAGYDADLNFLKNLLIPPTSASAQPVKFLTEQDYQNLNSNIPDGLSRSNHGDFKDALAQLGEGQLFGVTGFLYYAQPSGVESSNCQLPNNDAPEGSNVDYHIGIGFDSDLALQVAPPTASSANTKKVPKVSKNLLKTLQQNSVIVEMTPHYRFNFEHNVWTIENVRKAVGKQVKVIGQLIIDSEHNTASQNCAKATTDKEKQSCWRESVWELHPVVRFQVCNANSCALDSTDWVELDQLGGDTSTAGVGDAEAPPAFAGAKPGKKKQPQLN